MSSILRALKKIEKDSKLHEIQAGGEKIKVRHVVHKRLKASLTLRRLLGIAFFILLLLVTTVWIIIQTISKPSPNSRLALDSVDSFPEIKKSKIRTDADLSSNASLEKPAPEKSLEPPSFKTGLSRTIETGNDKIQQERMSEQNAVPKLTLKGILWSNIPFRRVAIINGRYLKQGDKIKGVVVLQIGKKSVTLQTGNKKWTIYLK